MMCKTKIVIRADASISIGSGHIIRCLTLAEELRHSGYDVIFITRCHDGNINNLIVDKEFKLFELSNTREQSLVDTCISKDYAVWLGTTQECDADECICILRDIKPDCLVVDHYSIDQTWEHLVRPYVGAIMVIDDLANRRHDCDLILDQNYFMNLHDRYFDYIPASCIKLFGPEYALLRSEFTHVRRKLRERDGIVNRVFVFFGGADPDNVTEKAIRALSEPLFRNIDADIVIGSSNPYTKEIANAVKLRPNTRLHIQVNNIAELIEKSDFAICAGGTITWERFCLGLPGLVVTIAENQKLLSMELSRNGYLYLLGDSKIITSADIAASLSNIIVDAENNYLMSVKSRQLVDGDGVKRVVAALSELVD